MYSQVPWMIYISIFDCILQIELGSTNVRVGSTIFGARAPPKQAKLNDNVQQTKENESSQDQQPSNQCLEKEEDETNSLQKLNIAC